MRKIWAMTWKELIVTFRDVSALLIMLVTPFGLTLVMLFAFGRGDDDSPLRSIPVHLVNHDAGEIGQDLVERFQSDALADLIDLTISTDEMASYAAVDLDEIAALVIAPASLSARLIPSFKPGAEEPASIEIYANPSRPISVGVVEGIVGQFVAAANANAVGVQVSVEQMIASGRIPPAQATWAEIEKQVASATPITLHEETAKPHPAFNWLSYYAPSMAILFLTFTASARTRSILSEREMGTLPRLMSTPITPAQIIAGKIVGAFATGMLQMSTLVIATTLLLRINWGAVAPVSILILVTVATMTSLGLAIAAVSRTAAQAGQYSMAVLLFVSTVGGQFIPHTFFPDWLKAFSYITPNTWGLEAFTRLAQGANFSEISVHLLVLLGMMAAYFAISIVAFRRQVQ